MDMTIYTSKHDAIKEILEEIKLFEEAGARKADEIARRIGKFSVIIQMHLAGEDKYLYPYLLKSSEPKTRAITSAYMAEMKQIEGDFLHFLAKFKTPDSIRKDFYSFQNDFLKINAAIRRRMEREERELYPLASA